MCRLNLYAYRDKWREISSLNYRRRRPRSWWLWCKTSCHLEQRWSQPFAAIDYEFKIRKHRNKRRGKKKSLDDDIMEEDCCGPCKFLTKYRSTFMILLICIFLAIFFLALAFSQESASKYSSGRETREGKKLWDCDCCGFWMNWCHLFIENRVMGVEDKKF